MNIYLLNDLETKAYEKGCWGKVPPPIPFVQDIGCYFQETLLQFDMKSSGKRALSPCSAAPTNQT